MSELVANTAEQNTTKTTYPRELTKSGILCKIVRGSRLASGTRKANKMSSLAIVTLECSCDMFAAAVHLTGPVCFKIER